MSRKKGIGARSAFPAFVLGVFLFLPPAGRAADASGQRPWRPLAVAVFAGGTEFISKDHPDGGIGYGGGVLWRMSKIFGLGVLVERFNGEVLVASNVMLNSYFFFAARSRLLPYAIAGVGFNSVEFDPGLEYFIYPGRFVDRMALQLGAGLEWRVMFRLSVTAEARSNLIKTWIMTGPEPERIRDIDPATQDIVLLYGLTFAAGLKFSF
jgi:hypothetical protein